MEASQELVQETHPQQYLDVQAPSDLREGYILWVNTENECLPVQVPSGGVLEGKTIPMAIVHQVNETKDYPTKESTGQWSHGLCSCFRRGLCHPHAWSVCFCPEIFLPQLLRKLKLDWAGSTSAVKSKSTTLRNCLIALIVLSYMATWFLRAPSSVTSSSSRNNTNNQWEFTRSEILLWEIAYVLLTLPAAIYGLMVTIRLRSAVRANANIPTGCLGCMEDCCCVFMCYGCTVSQMAGQVLEDDDETALTTCKNMKVGAYGTTTIGSDKEESAV